MEDRFTDGVKMPGNLPLPKLPDWAATISVRNIFFWVLPMRKILPAARF